MADEVMNVAIDATEAAINTGIDKRLVLVFAAGAVTADVTRLAVKKVKALIAAKKAKKEAEKAENEEVSEEE